MNQPTHRHQVADRAPGSLVERLLQWETILVLLLALVVAVNAIASPYFLDIWNLSDASFHVSEKAILALSMALLVLVRDIDLSVAAIVALVSLAMGLAAEAGWSAGGLVGVGLLAGTLCGVVNGALVTGLRLPSIVVTIGTMSLFRGIAQVVLGDQAITRYPAELGSLGRGYLMEWPPVPYGFALFLALALVFGLVLHRSVWGRWMFAIGNNPVASRFAGLPVARVRFALFVLSGLMAGIAGVLLTARIGSTRPNIALGWELEIVTMVILGGVSIAGGAGSILGVVLAVLVLGLATFGLGLVNVPGTVINVLIGLLLVVAIAAPLLARRLLGLATR